MIGIFLRVTSKPIAFQAAICDGYGIDVLIMYLRFIATPIHGHNAMTTLTSFPMKQA
jgi:hypothetical protein